MQAIIETTDPQQREDIKPFIDIVTAFNGHINRSYTHGVEFTSLDVTYKNLLLEKLRATPAASNYIIGAGSGHVYINAISAFRLKWDYGSKGKHPTPAKIIGHEPYSANGIHDRLLLITD